jgi:hypothetical protein
MYKALKQVRKLIAYEQELFEHANRGGRLPSSSEGNRQSA